MRPLCTIIFFESLIGPLFCGWQVFKAYASYFRYIFTLHPFLYAAPLAIRLGGKGTNQGCL